MQNRSIVLTGLMGVGKTTIGRRLAARLGLPFRDADHEIEKAAGRSVLDIFTDFGEAAFREGERKVIARLLDGSPLVLATGGGAFLHAETRKAVHEKALSIWLKAEIAELVKRTARRDTRPLLQVDDPASVLEELLQVRSPLYAKADIHIETIAGPHENTVQIILDTMKTRLEQC